MALAPLIDCDVDRVYWHSYLFTLPIRFHKRRKSNRYEFGTFHQHSNSCSSYSLLHDLRTSSRRLRSFDRGLTVCGKELLRVRICRDT